jgi:hypothetical protein
MGENENGYLELPVKRFWVEVGPGESRLVVELDGRASKVRLELKEALEQVKAAVGVLDGKEHRGFELLELQTLLTQTESQLVFFVWVGNPEENRERLTLGVRPKSWNLDARFTDAVVEVKSGDRPKARGR